MRNILLTIEYDGTDFHGWQKQPGMRTVQGELERVLSILCGSEIRIEGTGRTDARVHAYGQCATFHGEFGIPTSKIADAANNLLSPGGLFAGDIRIIGAKEVDAEFHARFSAKAKKYIYRIYNAKDIPVFKRNYYYRVKKCLDIENMKVAAADFIGAHDFLGFMASGGTPGPTTVRTIYSFDVGVSNNEIEFVIVGDGFLYNMVRIIAGTLVDVGLGKIECQSISDIILSRDRALAGHTAPPQGLYLAEVFFKRIDL